MFNIMLTDGKIIAINANEVLWNEKSRTIKLLYDREVIAIFNMDQIVGYVHETELINKEDKNAILKRRIHWNRRCWS